MTRHGVRELEMHRLDASRRTREDDGAFDDVLQLAHVARPRIALERMLGMRSEHVLSSLRGAIEEEARERHDLGAPLP